MYPIYIYNRIDELIDLMKLLVLEIDSEFNGTCVARNDKSYNSRIASTIKGDTIPKSIKGLK